MLLQMTSFHSFLWLRSIPLYICTTSSLSIPLSVNMQAASMFWLLYIVMGSDHWGACIFSNYAQEWDCWINHVVIIFLAF